jgi:hypothetical protein
LIILYARLLSQLYLADEELRDLWTSGISPGLTNVQRLRNLSILLNTIGPKDLLEGVIGQLRNISKNDPVYPMVNLHLKMLEETNG